MKTKKKTEKTEKKEMKNKHQIKYIQQWENLQNRLNF